VSFRGPGRPVTPGGEFVRSQPVGGVFRPGGRDEGTVLRDAAPIGMLGEAAISRSDTIRGQAPERVLRGAPKFWRVTNRAQLGNVKVWMGAFDGRVYPEDATDDKSTWLKAGEAMMLDLDAALFFFGNVFDPRLPDAEAIIERTGGLELETEEKAPGKNAPVRVVGGPIGLPDVLVEPIDGRLRPIGEPVAVYELYWGKLQRRGIMHRRSSKDPQQREVEAELLQQRIAEYTDDDRPIYGAGGEVIATVPREPIELRGRDDAGDEPPPDGEDLPDMRTVGATAGDASPK
jgi:hypothetical protein